MKCRLLSSRDAAGELANFHSRSLLPLMAALALAGSMAANATTVYGVSIKLNELLSFDTASPGILLSARSITGLQSGEHLCGIAWLNGILYGLGDSSRLYTLNPSSSAATQVGTGLFSPLLNGIFEVFHG